MPGVKGASGGHNRKPTAQLESEGAYREDRHGKRMDSKVSPATLPCPAELEGRAKEEWHAIVRELPREVITRLDSYSLLQYCRDVQQLEKAWPLHVADPLDRNYRMLVKDLRGRIRAAGKEFGLNPLARSGMQMPDEETPDESEQLIMDILSRNRKSKDN